MRFATDTYFDNLAKCQGHHTSRRPHDWILQSNNELLLHCDVKPGAALNLVGDTAIPLDVRNFGRPTAYYKFVQGEGFGARRIFENLVPTLLGSPCRGSVWLMTQELQSTLHPPSRRPSDMLLSEHITSHRASRLLAFHHQMNEQRTPTTDSGPSNQNKHPLRTAEYQYSPLRTADYTIHIPCGQQ